MITHTLVPSDHFVISSAVAIFGAFCIGVAFLAASLPSVPITQVCSCPWAPAGGGGARAGCRPR